MGDFIQFLIEDCLKDLRGLTARKMFGGYGLYLNHKICGIISKDRLYLKTDETNRKDFERYNMKPFTYAPEKTLKTYYEVPSHLLEDGEKLVQWIQIAASIPANVVRAKTISKSSPLKK